MTTIEPSAARPVIDGEEILRRLSIGDPAFCRALLADPRYEPSSYLDLRSIALARLGASIAVGSTGPMLRQRVSDALDVGLSFDDVVTVLLALAPTLGIEHVVTTSAYLAEALDYDVDAALEALDPDLLDMGVRRG